MVRKWGYQIKFTKMRKHISKKSLPLRYEKKFVITPAELRKCLASLALSSFRFQKLHPPRFVNSIYLEHPNYSSLADNLSGNNERVKYRIRWYGELLNDIRGANLEGKIKINNLGTKIRHTLPDFEIKDEFDWKVIKEKLKKSETNLSHILGHYRPVTLIRYLRSYYATSDKRFIVTVDTGLENYRLHPGTNLCISKFLHRDKVIVEVKYDQNNKEKFDMLNKCIPFPLSKHSKYVISMNMYYNE
jgi:hypothetical protein